MSQLSGCLQKGIYLILYRHLKSYQVFWQKLRSHFTTLIQIILLVLDRLHLHYDMQLVTFGIAKDMNLVVQFPIFIQPYTQKPLILYQLETVPVPILDKNVEAKSYTCLIIKKTYLSFKLRNIHITNTSRIKIM